MRSRKHVMAHSLCEAGKFEIPSSTAVGVITQDTRSDSFLLKQKGRRKGWEQRQIFIGGGGGS